MYTRQEQPTMAILNQKNSINLIAGIIIVKTVSKSFKAEMMLSSPVMSHVRCAGRKSEGRYNGERCTMLEVLNSTFLYKT